MQKKLLKLALQFCLNGGNPIGRSREHPKLGSLTNADVGVLAMWKQDPHNANIDGTVQRALQDFGQDV